MSDTRTPDRSHRHDPDAATEFAAAHRATGDSPANRTARRIVRLLRKAGQLAEAWADRHGLGCGCAYCRHQERAANTLCRELTCVWQFCSVWADLLDDGTLLTSAEAAEADRKAFEEYARRHGESDPTPTAVVGH